MRKGTTWDFFFMKLEHIIIIIFLLITYPGGYTLGSIAPPPQWGHRDHMWAQGGREASDSVKHHPETRKSCNDYFVKEC